jgi:hypothetical protein
MLYVKSVLSGLLAVALGGLIAFAVFLWNPYAEMFTFVSFDERDILLFGMLPVLIVFSVGFWWMFRRESKRFSKKLTT